MAAIGTERVLNVHHWTDTQFTFTTTRDSGLRFENGQFVMVGLHVDDRPLLRAYSIASANHEKHLEFLSIKVPDGPLTSRLQHIRKGDAVLISFSESAATCDGYGSMRLSSMPEYVNSNVTLIFVSALSGAMSSGFMWCRVITST